MERMEGKVRAMNELDKAWSDIYWSMPDNAFDYSDIHIATVTAKKPWHDGVGYTWAEVPF